MVAAPPILRMSKYVHFTVLHGASLGLLLLQLLLLLREERKKERKKEEGRKKDDIHTVIQTKPTLKETLHITLHHS